MSDSSDLLKARRVAHDRRYSSEREKNLKGVWSREGLTIYVLSDTTGGFLNRWTAQLSPGYQDNGKRTPYEEMAAVAVLIEAAPELKAACRESLAVLTEPGMMDVDEWKAWQKQTVCTLRSVLAKAEGRAH